MTNEEIIKECERAIGYLYLELPESIAMDVEAKVKAALQAKDEQAQKLLREVIEGIPAPFIPSGYQRGEDRVCQYCENDGQVEKYKQALSDKHLTNQ